MKKLLLIMIVNHLFCISAFAHPTDGSSLCRLPVGTEINIPLTKPLNILPNDSDTFICVKKKMGQDGYELLSGAIRIFHDEAPEDRYLSADQVVFTLETPITGQCYGSGNNLTEYVLLGKLSKEESGSRIVLQSAKNIYLQLDRPSVGGLISFVQSCGGTVKLPAPVPLK